jgi:hypothetical protein
MPQNSPVLASCSNYQIIFDNAFAAYTKKTGKDLASDPLLRRLETCQSPDSILDILREQIPGFNQSQASRSDSRLTMWLNSTVNVMHVFSKAFGGDVGQVRFSRVTRVKIARSTPML